MSVQRFARPLLIVFSILAIAWGTLAFGAVYPWAYYPLVTVCFGVGAAAVAIYRPARAPIGRVAIGLAAIAAIIGLQLVPLPSSTLERVSPGTGRYLRSYDLAYSVALAGDSVDGVSVGTASRPVSLNPAATRIGLLHFIAFAAFTVGLALLLSYAGAMPLIRGVTAIGVVVALVGIVQYTVSGGATYTLKLYGFWTPEFRGAPFGPFINRNHFAGWMLMGLPLAIACACGAATSFRGPGVRRFIAWLSGSPDAGQMQLMAGASALMALSVIMSNSRSGLLGFAVAALLATALVARRQRSGRGRMWVVLTAIFVIVVVAAWAGLDGLLDRLGTVSTGDESAGGRLGAWKDALTIVSRFPWMGAGLNAFGAAMMEYQTG
ncbi:MAG TPA: O-antigen ligase family protein, partial [Gemmatimonadaceae bacterium]